MYLRKDNLYLKNRSCTAREIYERPLFLSEWLEKLGVNPVVLQQAMHAE